MKSATARTAVRFQNILFATDFSSAAARAIPYVKRIAKYYEADVLAFHVRPPVADPMAQPATWPSEETVRRENEQLRKNLLDTFAGLPARALIEEGDIHNHLKSAIEENSIDLVIVGTRGRTGLGKLLLGSVAEEIFRTVPCPVLTVGPHTNAARDAAGEFREILFATDFTSESKSSAAYAVSLAQEYQARLVLLHVIAAQGAGQPVSASDAKHAARELLYKLVPAEAHAWCKPEYFVECGVPSERILELARLRGSDLIVLGVKSEEGMPGAATHLPIATAHKIVSHAECPVLTVRS